MRNGIAQGIAVTGLLLLLLFGVGCKDKLAALEQYLQDAQRAWGFQGAVLIAVDGEPLLSRGYGTADLVFGDPNTPTTRFYIASITKQFTAALILILQQDGLLDVNDPINKFLPEFASRYDDTITIHQLLTHTSGLPNYTEVPEILFRRSDPLRPTELLAAIENQPLEFTPGDAFHYSNTGYLVLGAIIEEVAGQSYEAFLHSRLLNPIGMTGTGYSRPESGLPQRASGYTLNASGVSVVAAGTNPAILHTAGALHSTAEDLLRWDQALYSDSILTRRSKDLMFATHAEDYGYGWRVDTLYGHIHQFHGGYLEGFVSAFERWPEKRLAIVVLANDDKTPVGKMARSMAAILLGKPYDRPVKRTAAVADLDVLSDYVGTYVYPEGVRREVTLNRGKLSTWLGDNDPHLLLPMATDTFFFADDNSVLVWFDRDSSAEVASLSLVDEQLLYIARRLPDTEKGSDREALSIVSLDPEALRRFAGTYRLASQFEGSYGELTAIVTLVSDHLELYVPGAGQARIRPLSETEFIQQDREFRIRFVVDANGVVTGCVLDVAGGSLDGIKVE